MPLASDDDHAKLQEFINYRNDASTSFEITVNQDTLEKELNRLSDGKAVGVDGIPTTLLWLSSSVILTIHIHFESVYQNHHLSWWREDSKGCPIA